MPSVAATVGTYAAALSGTPEVASACATNSRHSSWLLPSMTGTWLNAPLVKALASDWVSTYPSTVGLAPACRASTVSTGKERRHAAVWAAHPARVAKADPAASAVVNVAGASRYAPLSTI